MVGEVEQEGIVAGEVVAAEEDVKGDENFMCMVLDEDVLDKDFEGRLEGGASLDEANEEVVKDGVSLFYVGREGVVRGVGFVIHDHLINSLVLNEN